jgi:oxygen-independent coproporphyrinogen-3 oxidase
MKNVFDWDEAEEVTFECEPGTLTKSKLRVIRELGITRLSLGIENYDDRILKVNGRAHASKEINRSYEFARSMGFSQINIDLIAGMIGETDANWRKCVRKTIALAPDSVTIYQMEIPFNTTVFKEMKARGEHVAPVADWPTKRGWVKYAFDELEKAGYTVGSAYTAVRNPRSTRFLYRDMLWKGADLIGVGVASFGHIGGTHFQNEHEIGAYVAKVAGGELPIYRALTPTPDQRLIREFILQLKLGRVRGEYFKKKFGIDIHRRFQQPLHLLQDMTFLTTEGDTVKLSRDGLLQVDRLLHEFFLPEHRNARYT